MSLSYTTLAPAMKSEKRRLPTKQMPVLLFLRACVSPASSASSRTRVLCSAPSGNSTRASASASTDARKYVWSGERAREGARPQRGVAAAHEPRPKLLPSGA
jgi:hypothetical protein